MAKVATIDYSLRQPAICIGETNKPYFDTCLFYYVGKTKYANCLAMPWCLDTRGLSIERFERHVQCIRKVLGKHCIKKVYIESIAYRARNFQFAQAAGTQYVTDRLQQLGYTVEVVNIGTIKKAFTGKGNASKAQMMAAFKNGGCTLPVTAPYWGDIIDAFAIFHAITKEKNEGEMIFKDKRRKNDARNTTSR